MPSFLHSPITVESVEAAETTYHILKGEIFKMILNIPTRENTKNPCVASIVPLRSHFSNTIVRLEKYFWAS